MKLTIEGTTEEIKNALQAICGSEERNDNLKLDNNVVKKSITSELQNHRLHQRLTADTH